MSNNISKRNKSILYYCTLQYLRFRNYISWIRGKYIDKSGYSIKFHGIKKREIKQKLEKFNTLEKDSQIDIRICKLGINTFKLEPNLK
jgi:hypothetical protein